MDGRGFDDLGSGVRKFFRRRRVATRGSLFGRIPGNGVADAPRRESSRQGSKHGTACLQLGHFEAWAMGVGDTGQTAVAVCGTFWAAASGHGLADGPRFFPFF